MLLYHATAQKNLPSIALEGLRARSYWTSNPALAAYYMETVEDDGETPVLLTIQLEQLAPAHLSPDLPGIEEPITTVLGESEEDIWEAWGNTDKTWQSCLELVGSLRVDIIIAPSALSVTWDTEQSVQWRLCD